MIVLLLALRWWARKKWAELCAPKVVRAAGGGFMRLCPTCAGYDPVCPNVAEHW